MTLITNFASSGPIGLKIGQMWAFFPEITEKMSALWLEWLQSYEHVHLPIEALKLIEVMFWSTFIALQHLLILKYQADT